MSHTSDASAPRPANGRPPYDLATCAADYPEWTGPPLRTLLICTHPRCGSTLLGEAVYFAGGLGCPLEYFHRGFRPYLAGRWEAGDIRTFLRAVYRFRTDPSGVLAVKLFWRDIEDILKELSPSLWEELLDRDPASIAPGTYREIGRVVAEIFPNPFFVRLARHDRVRQAVSTLVASQTDSWRSIPSAGEQAPRQEAGYDYRRILDCLGFSDYCNEQWSNFFSATGEPFRGVAYEELVKHYGATLSGMFAALGRSVETPPIRMRRQSNPTSERMVLRFLKEYMVRAAGIPTEVQPPPDPAAVDPTTYPAPSDPPSSCAPNGLPAAARGGEG